MRILSVKQPWASLIASGKKTIELRSWNTDYRGLVLIIAGSRPDKTEHENGPLGVAICIVNLVDCRPSVVSDEERACHPIDVDVAEGGKLYSWILEEDNLKVPNLPIKGQLGLYKATDELTAKLLNIPGSVS